jgi:hypothetical protein
LADVCHCDQLVCQLTQRLGGGARQRKLHPLADRPVEDDPLLRVFDAFVQKPPAVADAFLRDQNALGVHAVEAVAEALPFLANEVIGRISGTPAGFDSLFIQSDLLGTGRASANRQDASRDCDWQGG